MEPNQTNKSPVFKIILGVIVAIIIFLGVHVFLKNEQSNVVSTDQNTGNSSNTSSTTPNVVVSDNKKYVDGTYSAVGSYATPEQGEKIGVTVVLKDGIVTDASVNLMAKDRTSKRMQQDFADGFKTEVVGKPIDQISLTVVNGSSLTSNGFMDALNQIKAQAEVKA